MRSAPVVDIVRADDSLFLADRAMPARRSDVAHTFAPLTFSIGNVLKSS